MAAAATVSVPEAGLYVLGTGAAASVEVGEAFVAALSTGPTGGVHIAEAYNLTLAYRGECGTQNCDLWRITRRDGAVFAFTSLDVDFTYLGTTFKHCASLQDSASESSADLGSVGSIQLTGLLSDESITDEDIYAGKFDDAVVEVWVVNWGEEPSAPFKVAGGWMGKLSFGQANWSGEVLGPGARLQQTALVDFFTPGCRWNFGQLDSEGIGCPVDSEALAIIGVQVTGARGRYAVFFDAAFPGGPAIWNGGTVRWTYGANAGVECQVNEVDFSAQALSLWDLAPFPPQEGDSFDLIPGCPKTKAACQAYGVYVSFGGFEDIPGPDALQSNADSLFTASNG